MYQRKVDVDMLNAVKSVLADVSSVSPSSEQRLIPGVLAEQKVNFLNLLVAAKLIHHWQQKEKK